MSRFVFAVLITCALSACGPRGLRWDYTIPSTLEGSPMRAAVRDGGCEGAVRWETDFVDGATSSAPPTLPAGTYGVELEVLDETCNVVARGCEVVMLPMDQPAVSVAVVELGSPEPGTCGSDSGMPGAPDGGVDAAFDTGPVDAASSDTGAPDGGEVGSECTTEDDCECGDACTRGWCVATRPATAIDAGSYHTCAIADGALYCWGQSHMIGEVGGGWSSAYAVPTRIGLVSGWTDLSVLSRTTCGIAANVVRCWGSNYTAQGGIEPAGANENLFVPTAVDQPLTATRIAMGSFQGFVLDATGALAGWGNNEHNQVGLPGGITGNPILPRTIGTDSWLAIASGEFFTCGVASTHTLFCWGAAFDESIGGGGWPATVRDPTPGVAGPMWTDVALGLTHACAWDADGAFYCWGQGTEESAGALGAGAEANTSEPVRVTGIVARQASLSNHTCVVETDGDLWCFGPNDDGQLGNGSMGTGERSLVPSRVEGRGWTHVAAGLRHTCGIRNGGIYCWGSDVDLQLGNGATVTESQPLPVRICLP